ncbi:MAG: sigma 54-interacting transcriptional regulator, partial [Candidatus Hydrogenedentes bacterium]|nr:sigma 54-interacting transcriptional regulator [Candidatus Hydrogenedentota bacterium]
MWSVVVKKGHTRGIRFSLDEAPLTIGRGRQCNLVVSEATVSRFHCEIALRRDGPWISQIARDNTTLLNGVPVSSASLHAGDELVVGETVLLITQDGAIGASGSSLPDARTCSLDLKLESSIDLFAQHGRPRTTRDLADLYLLGRRLSAVEQREEAVTVLIEALRRRFDAVQVAFYWSDTRGELVCEQCGPAEAVNRKAALEAWETGRAVSSGPSLAVPLCVGGLRLGALLLELAQEPEGPATQELVDLFAAYALAAAPYLHCLERLEELRREMHWLRLQHGDSHGLVGDSPAIQQARAFAARVAKTNLNVLITGETGTGKELVANMIHALSPRSGQQLVILNCATIPEELFESELFGHERGAFTGATAPRMGRMEQADGGTLFLDEIGDLSLENQAKILRAIETGVFHRVGSDKETRVNLRVVAATNKSLNDAIAGGAFREDLYHRLNGVEIQLPPLRERRDDVETLARHFFAVYSPTAPKPVRGIAPAAFDALRAYRWPGNVRELRQAVQRGVQMAMDEWVTATDLLGVAATAAPATTVAQSLRDVESAHIRAMLAECSGNISAAATRLGIHRNTLANKIRE